MTQFKFDIKITPSYERGETPNYGQHPMVIFFTLTGSRGTIVMEVNSSWYISEAKSWTFPHSEMKRGLQQPYVPDVTLHRHVDEGDLFTDPQEMHDDCGWLHGETCVTERIASSSEAHEWLALLIGEGPEAIEAKMKEVYLERFPNAIPS